MAIAAPGGAAANRARSSSSGAVRQELFYEVAWLEPNLGRQMAEFHCDRTIRRFEAETGQRVTLGIDGPEFASVAAKRAAVLEEA